MKTVAVDVRSTSRMSVGMKLYTNALHRQLPTIDRNFQLQMWDYRGNLAAVEQCVMPLASLAGTDAVHYTSIAGILTPRPFVITIHDLHFLKFTELLSARSRQLFYAYAKAAAYRATRIIVDDDRTVEDCQRLLGISPGKCRVVPLGYDPEILSAKPVALERPYIFYAGNHSSHKLVDRLVHAWAMLPRDIDMDLILTGHENKVLRDIPESMHPTRRLRFLGDIDAATLWSHFAGAMAYVHPAAAEGFGLPMLEAMAIGTPVVASAESIPLILKEAATTYPAFDTFALRDILTDVARRPETYKNLAIRARIRALPFTWKHCAEQTSRIYEELL